MVLKGTGGATSAVGCGRNGLVGAGSGAESNAGRRYAQAPLSKATADSRLGRAPGAQLGRGAAGWPLFNGLVRGPSSTPQERWNATIVNT